MDGFIFGLWIGIVISPVVMLLLKKLKENIDRKV